MTLLERFNKVVESGPGRKQAQVWLDHVETMLKLSTSRGKARGGGQSSKAKGRAAVCVVRDLLAEELGIPVGAMMVKATSMPGADLYLSPEAMEKFPYDIEVKSVEALNIWAALAQAAMNAKLGVPVVFFKRAKSPMFVALNAYHFLALRRAFNEAGCKLTLKA